ncbi:leucine-rich repeat domain-containing protein [Clostridium sp. FP1]|uniref:leucine-rich repeat domain-containing protein n=1 Tax=Clostridium sp. FP1 TaxID=2724076 RepID=UPI0013E9221E|nr:leucine-rich repeat domain-containing protein [Clostridium sp. FP1]MBZ9634089.1 leucine-rich repeat domain-containing protein [Clostridium sp. FP1]
MIKSNLLSKTYIKIVLVFLIIVGLFSIFQYKTYLNNNVLKFENKNFEKLVRMTIHKPKGHIFKKDLENIKKLQANFGNPLAILNGNITYKITDLDGIQYFKNLEIVSLVGHDISDISPLSSLSNLKRLNISSNRNLTNISPLSKLSNLEYLDISSIKELTNISPLSKLTKLEYLDAIDNKIKDVYPLSTLPNIKTLRLSINEIEDISSLNKLSSLTNLHLGANKIKDVRPLSNMTHLKVLQLEKNPITDFTPLDSLKSVEIKKELM